MPVLGVALVEPYQSSKYFVLQTNKHPWERCQIAFPKKHLEHAAKNCLWWTSLSYWSRVRYSSWTFSTFSEQPFCRPHANNFFWSFDVFLIFDKEYLMSKFFRTRNSQKKVCSKSSFLVKRKLYSRNLQLYFQESVYYSNSIFLANLDN